MGQAASGGAVNGYRGSRLGARSVAFDAGAFGRFPGITDSVSSHVDAGQFVDQGRSFSGLRTAQMCVIRSSAMSNATTTTVTPSC